MPAVTVLMPVYNGEKYLSAAMESILSQTFTDYEFLIMDDGSTDQSIPIIESYQDPRIRLYQNEQNLGISATLNKGIEQAQADLIARMDADDVSHPTRLEKQVAYMQANPDCAMVSSLVQVITEDGHPVRQDKFKSEHFYYNLTFICWIYHPTVLYRKRAVKAVGGYTTPYSEDFELFWQLTRQFLFYNLPEILLDYRVTSQSLHQVLRKQEYKLAQQQQLLRNIQYYTGPDFVVPESFLECYQHNFQPLLEERNVTSVVVSCLKKLDYITQCLLATPNINLNQAAVQKAAVYKKRFIVEFYLQHFAWWQKACLLLQAFSLKDMLKFWRAKERDKQPEDAMKPDSEPQFIPDFSLSSL